MKSIWDGPNTHDAVTCHGPAPSARLALRASRVLVSAKWPELRLDCHRRFADPERDGYLVPSRHGRSLVVAVYFPYPAATMLVWTALSFASDAKPVVMTPSKKLPTPLLLLSPPIPRMIAPCFFIGL